MAYWEKSRYGGPAIESKFFKARKIFPDVTLISGLAGEQCYLIEGREKALLIDALSGIGSLRAFVRELTDLPVELVLTHNHVDHIGAAFEYGKAYIHPEDIPGLYEMGDASARLGFVDSQPRAGRPPLLPEDVTPSVPIRTFPANEGTVFDLGGKALEVIHVPGHTWGSIVLLDRAQRVIYSGDAVNANTLLFLGGASIEEYREALLRLNGYAEACDLLWGGHGGVSVPFSIVPEAIRLCEEILAGPDDGVPGDFLGRPALYARKKDRFFRRLDGGIANIAYSRDRLWKEQVAAPAGHRLG